MKAIRIFAVAALLMLLSVTALSAYNGSAARSIYVTIDGERKGYRTTAETIGEFFEEVGIEIFSTDTLNVKLTDLVVSARGVTDAPAREVIILRGIDITVNYESKSEQVTVKHEATGFMLAQQISEENGKTYTFDGDRLEVLIAGNEYNLFVNIGGKLLPPQVDRRVFDSEDYTIEYITIPFKVEVRPTFDLSVGNEKVIREGVDGKKEILYRIGFLDGTEQFRDIIKENIIEQDLSKIVERGIAGTLEDDLTKLNVVKKLDMNASAYTADFNSTGKNPGDPGFGVTASGLYVRLGIVAVDPAVIPLGTKLYVEGYGYSIAADKGSAIKGNKIDLYFETAEEAIQFGRRNITVYVLAD